MSTFLPGDNNSAIVPYTQHIDMIVPFNPPNSTTPFPTHFSQSTLESFVRKVLTESPYKTGSIIKAKTPSKRHKQLSTYLLTTLSFPLNDLQVQVNIYLQYQRHFEARLYRHLQSCLYQSHLLRKTKHQLELFLDGYRRHQQHPSQQHIRQRLISCNRRSTTRTSIFTLPPEILRLLPKHIDNPRDLFSLSQSCKAFQELCDDKLWFNMYLSLVSHWSTDAQFHHLGQAGLHFPWRQVVLDDYFRNIRHLDLDLAPTLNTIDNSDRPSVAPQCKWTIELGHSLEIRPNHLGPAPPLSSPLLMSNVKGAGCAQTVNAKPMWRNTGPPVSYTDPLSHFTVTAYLQAQSTTAPSGDQHTVYQVVLYRLDNHDSPLAIIPGSLWSDSNRTNLQRPANPGPMIGQLMDIRRYAHQKDILGRTRILFVMAFGERVPTATTMPERAPGEIEMELLDIWTQGKIVEVYIYDSPQAATLPPSPPEHRPSAPYWGRVQHIDPSPQHPTLIRGRAIKLYSIRDLQTGQEQDRIALFGIHHDGASSIVMLTGPVFPASAPSSSPYMDPARPPSSTVPMTIRHVTERLHDAWSPCFFGSTDVAETTSMTLFPAHSDFEHLMVIVDRRGNGEIWDWINNKLVASLTIAEDERMQKNPSLRQNLYFWGVQVNWTIEEPARTMSSGLAKIEEVQERSFFRKHGDFRIVALADGQDSEWETIRWNIKETDLREQQSGRLGEAGWEVKSMNRHYEACTMGQTHVVPCGNLIGTDAMVVDNEPQPLLFIAFLIWDHYRIALTSKFGLCLFDMNGEMPVDILTTDPAFRSRLPMWVTDLEDATQNPLLDIATAGDYLILTRRYSHILWPFRKVVT